MQITLEELQSCIPGAVRTGDVLCQGLSTDTRKIGAGNLFIALRGEHFDAHDFIQQAVDAGAAAVVVEKAIDGLNVPALIVPDAKQALLLIATHWREKFSLPVIAVTGSNGKTTVKEMIASILQASFGNNYLATSGNLNNEIGVPLTVLRLTAAHRAAVIELGMNHPGEIEVLARVAQANVGLVNNAQREHQEFMQSVAAVAEENGHVIRALPASGVAVFPAEDEFSGLWQGYAQEQTGRSVLSFGFSTAAGVSASYQLHAFGSSLQIQLGADQCKVDLQAAGLHNVRNALAAAACCHAIGISTDDIQCGLENFAPVTGRLQRKQASNGATVIDDTYNANPDSVRAAIDVLAQAGVDGILVLGDMGEVGTEGPAFHREIGAYAAQRQIKHLFTLGQSAQFAAQAYGSGAQHFDDVAALTQHLQACLLPTSTILVKGSRFMKMERIVSNLTQQQSVESH